MVKTAERPGARSTLTVGFGMAPRRLRIAGEGPAYCTTMVDRGAAAAAGTVEIVPVIERDAVGNVAAVVEENRMAPPIRSPIRPAPAKVTHESDSKAATKREVGTAVENPGIVVPLRPYRYEIAIHPPRIVCRHVDNIGADRINADRRVLIGHRLLRRALQVPGLLRALPHDLYRIHQVLLLVVVG